MNAETQAECQHCQRQTRHSVIAGHPVCQVCGWSAHRVSTQSLPAEFEMCPRCGQATALRSGETLACYSQVLDVTDQTCRFVGYEEECTVHRQVLECLAEDRRRGEKGGGSRSNGKGRKKEGTAGVRMENWDNAESKIIDNLRGARKHVLSLPDIEEDAEFIRAAIVARLMGEI